MICLAVLGWNGAAAVTLVSRSQGLELPSKEEGNTEFEVADVNGDGYPDIVSVGDHGSPYVNSDQHGIMTWTGSRNTVWTVYQYGDFGYGGCGIGDLDGDGFSDVAWGIHHNMGSGMGSRLMGAARGNGTAQVWTDWGSGLGQNGEEWGMFATDLADFNCDGNLDIVSQSFGGSNGVRVYRNNGDGTWTMVWNTSGGVGSTLETGDINNDGYLDIVSTRSSGNVFLGNGAFGFQLFTTGLPGDSIRGIDCRDINGDGHDDFSCALGSIGIRCFTYNPSTPAWEDASSGLPESGTYELTQLGDLNGDGHPDLITYKPMQGAVYLGDGTGTWTADATWTMPSPGDGSALRVDGDIDFDGREDIVVSAVQSGFPFSRNQLRVYSPWQAPDNLGVRVISPDGMELLRNGSTRWIRWISTVPESSGIGTVKIELSLNGETGPWQRVAANAPNSGRFQWHVAAETASTACRLKITVTTDTGSAFSLSPVDFIITGSPPPSTATPASPTSTPTPPDTPPPTPTLTPEPTSMQTSTPTHIFTQTPIPSYTPPPSQSPTPTFPDLTSTPFPSPTSPCSETGVALDLPLAIYHAGDVFYLRAWICNATDGILDGYPLFVLLDVYGDYWFAPEWIYFRDGMDYYSLPFPQGLSEVTVLEPFAWPDIHGEAQGIRFCGALTNPEMTELFGAMDFVEFGWE